MTRYTGEVRHELSIVGIPCNRISKKRYRVSALKKIFIDNVTAKSIYEPLLCCPAASRAEHPKRCFRILESLMSPV